MLQKGQKKSLSQVTFFGREPAAKGTQKVTLNRRPFLVGMCYERDRKGRLKKQKPFCKRDETSHFKQVAFFWRGPITKATEKVTLNIFLASWKPSSKKVENIASFLGQGPFQKEQKALQRKATTGHKPR